VHGTHAVYIQPSQVVARFASVEEAALLLQSIAGARGEYVNRERRAREAYEATVAQLIERATK
jgi:hypothetical protein